MFRDGRQPLNGFVISGKPVAEDLWSVALFACVLFMGYSQIPASQYQMCQKIGRQIPNAFGRGRKLIQKIKRTQLYLLHHKLSRTPSGKKAYLRTRFDTLSSIDRSYLHAMDSGEQHSARHPSRLHLSLSSSTSPRKTKNASRTSLETALLHLPRRMILRQVPRSPRLL